MQYRSENSSAPAPKLLDQVRGKIRLKHYTISVLDRLIRIGLNALFWNKWGQSELTKNLLPPPRPHFSNQFIQHFVITLQRNYAHKNNQALITGFGGVTVVNNKKLTLVKPLIIKHIFKLIIFCTI